MAVFYGVSEKSLYRALRLHLRPKALRRSDHGVPRVLPREKMEHYCELIAAVKVRTSNQKGRCLSTGETIWLMEDFGIETPEGLVKVDPGRDTTLAARARRLRGSCGERSAPLLSCKFSCSSWSSNAAMPIVTF